MTTEQEQALCAGQPPSGLRRVDMAVAASEWTRKVRDTSFCGLSIDNTNGNYI